MASRSSAVAAAAVLLIAVQMVSAHVVPEVVLMRIKRSPDPMRSFSFSGFNPNGQMAAFTGLGEYPQMFANYGPPSQADGPQYYESPQSQDQYSPSIQDSYGPPPSGTEQHATGADADPHKKHQHGVNQQEYGARPGASPADSKEQSNNSVEQTDTKKQHRGRDGPSSNAEASFNAWFPIMFGVFPNGGASGQSGNAAANRGNNNYNQGQGQDQGNSGYDKGFERSSGGATVIANSVSNGRNGVATSHAVYGSPRSQK